MDDSPVLIPPDSAPSFSRRRPIRDLDLSDLYRRVINRNNRLKKRLS
jgi:DNA-directed RNA polymerase beta' subunit